MHSLPRETACAIGADRLLAGQPRYRPPIPMSRPTGAYARRSKRLTQLTGPAEAGAAQTPQASAATARSLANRLSRLAAMTASGR